MTLSLTEGKGNYMGKQEVGERKREVQKEGQKGKGKCITTEKRRKRSAVQAVNPAQCTSRKSLMLLLLQKLCDPVLLVDPVIQSEANTTP